jgi:phosphatidylglycerophosphate synthase
MLIHVAMPLAVGACTAPCGIANATDVPVLSQAVKVNSLGKWKTALQMTSMSVLLFCKDTTGWIERQLQGTGQCAALCVVLLSCVK